MQWIRRHLKVLLPVTVVGLGVIAYLAFAVFGVHTLFIDDKVDEAGPVFDSGAAAVAVDAEVTGDGADTTTSGDTELATPTESATDPATDSERVAADEPVPDEAPAATSPPAPQIVTLAEGSFIPLGRYSGEGRAVVLNDGSEQRFVRFENFSTDNGPDLRVYLSVSDADGPSGAFDDDFIDLGVLKGNIGDQNYEIPVGVDLSIYDTVVVWCVRFSTPFTAADLV
jgi:hypothetical protein